MRGIRERRGLMHNRTPVTAQKRTYGSLWQVTFVGELAAFPIRNVKQNVAGPSLTAASKLLTCSRCTKNKTS